MKDNDRYWDCLDQAMEASHGGRTDEALAWLDEALKAQPNGAEAHNGRGEILWDDGRVEEALYQFELAVMADPKFLTAHLNRAELLIEEMSEHEQAIELCDRLLSGAAELPKPDRATEAEIHYLKSKALFYLDDLEGALFLVRRAIQKSRRDRRLPRLRGPALLRARALRGGAQAPVSTPSPWTPSRPTPSTTWGSCSSGSRARTTRGAPSSRRTPSTPTTTRCRSPSTTRVFERITAEALSDLPRSIREYVEHMPVLVRDFPDVELLSSARTSRRRSSASSSACRAPRRPAPPRRATSTA